MSLSFRSLRKCDERRTGGRKVYLALALFELKEVEQSEEVSIQACLSPPVDHLSRHIAQL